MSIRTSKKFTIGPGPHSLYLVHGIAVFLLLVLTGCTGSGPVEGGFGAGGGATTSAGSGGGGSGSSAGTPNLKLSPQSVSFGQQAVGASSTPQTVTVSNSGNAAGAISSVTVSNGMFIVSGSFSQSIAPGQSVPLNVSFAPSTTGTVTAAMTVTDSTGTALTANLSGTGVVVSGVLGASPASLAFGSQALGATTQPMTVTVTNTGNAAASITSITSSNAVFAVAGISLPFTLSPSQSVSFGVTFTPTSATGFSSTLTINSTANNSPQTLTLSGTGVVVGGVLTVNPASLTFGSQAVGSKTPAQTVTVTNSASGNATIFSIASSNAVYAVTGITLPFTLNPTQSVQFGVTFAPSSATSFPATLTITSTANNSPQTVTLSGDGVAPVGVLGANPTVLAFGQQSVGAASSPQLVSILNSGATPASISSIASSDPTFTVSGVTLPVSIGPSQSIQFSVSFSPTSATSFSGTLTITSTASNSPQTINLSGSGVVPAGVLAESPASLAFGQQAVSVPSTPQIITITNNGAGPATVSSISSSNPVYTISGVALPVSIGPSQSIQVNVTFTPTSGTTFNATLTITSTASNSPQSVALSGTGIVLSAILGTNPGSLAFGQQSVGATSSPQTVTISNSGTSPASISSIASSDPTFTVSGVTLPVSIGPSQSIQVNVSFSPTAATPFAGTLTITSSASNSPQTLSMSGSGVLAAGVLAISPGSLDFGQQAVGSPSTPQAVTITNSGAGPATVSGITSSNPAYTVSGVLLPISIGPAQSIQVNVTFTPTSATSFNAALTITSTASNSPQSVTLSGTGIVLSAVLSSNPTSLAFGQQGLGITSSAQTITLQNSGNVPAVISSIATNNPAFIATGLTLPASLGAGMTTTLNVSFTPAQAISYSASLTITSSATNSPLTVPLTGDGIGPQFTVIPSSLNFANQGVNTTSAPQLITVNNTGTVPLLITQAAVTPSPGAFAITGPAMPLTVNSGNSAVFSVTFRPSSATLFSGFLNLTTNGSSTATAIPLSGTGVNSPPPTVSIGISPTSFDFGTQTINQTSGGKTIVLTNTGTANLTINSVQTTAPYAISGFTGSTTLTPGQTLNVSVTFHPTAVDTFAGMISISSTAASSPDTVFLTGQGVSAFGGCSGFVALSTTTLNFGLQSVGFSSQAQTIDVTNTGSGPMSITSVTSDNGAFAVTGPALPLQVNANGSATFSVTFSPTFPGALAATLTITSDACNSPNSVTLDGSGVFPLFTLSVSTLNFGNQTVGTTSNSQTVTLTNTGVVDIVVNSVNITPSQFTVQLPQATPITVPPGGTSDFLVKFSPNSAQGFSGTLTFNTSGNPSISTVSLAGVGTPATLLLNTAPTTIDFQTQPINTISAGRPVLVTNTGNAAVTVSNVTTSSPFAFTGFTGSTTLNPNQTLTLTVTFGPATATSFSGTLSITSNATTSPNNVSLQGIGIIPSGAAPYSAITDRLLRPEPQLITLGPAGFKFTDPIFGSRMLRVTDALTRPDKLGADYHSPASSEANSWNKDGTKFWVEGAGGSVIPFNFDPVNMIATRMGNLTSPTGGLLLPLRASPSFSFVDPDLIYGFPGGAPFFTKYTFSTGVSTRLHDPKTCLPNLSNFSLDLSGTANDQRFAAHLGGTIQDTQNIVYIFDQTLGCRWLQTDTGVVGGQWGPTGSLTNDARFLMHNLRISRDGKYIRLAQSKCLSGTCTGIYIWDVDTMTLTLCNTAGPPYCQGHAVMGYATMISQTYLKDGAQWGIRPTTNVNNQTGLISPVLPPTFPAYFLLGSHPSWNNVQPNNSQPVCMATFRGDHTAIARPWDDEIICMRTDLAQYTVWRFAHHRSRQLTFYTQVLGNVSQDGKFYMFTTDWEGTIVTATFPNRCCDVFIVELK